MKKIIYIPIGIIHTPFKATKGIPKKPMAGKNVEGFRCSQSISRVSMTLKDFPVSF
jgi:hypothetical protein